MIDHITQHTYDNIAPEFARINATMPQNLLAAMQRFVALVGDSASILDLGCGTGRDSAYMQSRGLWVVSADFSTGMLSQAKTIGASNLVQMDMRAIGFCDHRFQGVWCCASLLHLPKQAVPDALAEIHRVLAPRGALFLAVQQGTTEGYELNSYNTKTLERFFARYSESETRTLLQANDFRVIESSVVDADVKRWIQIHAIAQ